MESAPEKDRLTFDLPDDEHDSEVLAVMQNISQLAEKLLYRWKSYPIFLPKSSTQTLPVPAAGNTAMSSIGFKDLFIAPSFDELEEVARDSSGQLKDLTDEQLVSIRKIGEFEVPSNHFPDQQHRWRLSILLQKGFIRAHDSLLDDSALALRIVCVTAYNRFFSGFFSLSHSVRAWGRGLWILLDIIFGMPSVTSGNITSRIAHERKLHLVAELDIKGGLRKYLASFCEYVKDKTVLLKREKIKVSELKPPPLPYTYQSPKGLDIHLPLFNRDLMNKCLPMLHGILERESKGWYVSFSRKMAQSLKSQGLAAVEISKKVNEAIKDEYVTRVFDAILSNDDIRELNPLLGSLLVNQAKSVLAMEKACEDVSARLQREKSELETRLRQDYPIRSRIPSWLNDKLFAFENSFYQRNQWVPHEECIKICEEKGLTQTLYFLKRDLTFIKEREPILRKELAKVNTPHRLFDFNLRIWFPQNWVVKRLQLGKWEQISTVIVEEEPSTNIVKSNEEGFSVTKYTTRKTSSRYPLWRWWNYLSRTWVWTWNTVFWLLIVVPWYSPFSLRALTSLYSFIPDLELSQVDGSLFPKPSSLTHTLVSRLRLLWDNVYQSRQTFEQAPDSSFLGKSFTRHLNRFWNFVIKGAFGSVALVIVFPPLCLVISLLSLSAAITAPIWMPIFSLFLHVFFCIIYDLDSPDENRNQISILCEAIIYRIIFQGCLQPLAAFFTGVIICPLACVSVLIYAGMKRAFRALWDNAMFHLIIKKRGRVPANNNFVAKRISGPGLASNYFYQIKPEQALAAFEAKLELDELEAWEAIQESTIKQPLTEYRTFVERCFTPFSANLVHEGVFKQLKDETDKYLYKLSTKADIRRKQLRTGLTVDLRNKIKLPESDLKKTIVLAADLIKGFYPDHVMKQLPMPTDEFWESRGLETDDWRGLACRKLTDIFSPNFLIPLEQTDSHFKLDVQHINLSRYVDMLAKAEFHDDLDSVTEIHTNNDELKTGPPDLDTYYFLPDRDTEEHLGPKALGHRRQKRPWKQSRIVQNTDKLQIPLPIPHPVYIAILVYNRDHDQEPIDTEDPQTHRIMRTAKEGQNMT